MQQENPRFHPQQRNPYTHESHRRQAFWQILFPLIVFLILVLTAGALTIIAPAGQASRYADISLIFMILFMMVFGLFFVLVAGASVFGVRQVIKTLPGTMFRVQVFFSKLERRVAAVANRSVEPILRVRSAAEGARAVGRSLREK